MSRLRDSGQASPPSVPYAYRDLKQTTPEIPVRRLAASLGNKIIPTPNVPVNTNLNDTNIACKWGYYKKNALQMRYSITTSQFVFICFISLHLYLTVASR